MIDVSGDPAGQRGVHHPLVVQSEHVDPAVLGLVSLLPYVRQLATDNLYNLDLGSTNMNMA